MIPEEILLAYGAVYGKYRKGALIFEEEMHPQFYHQVITGCVKMVNIHESGKEFIQGLFGEMQSFGEPVLFINKGYPSSAVAETDCTVLRLSLSNFEHLLHDFPKFYRAFLVLFSQRLHQKSIMCRELSGYPPVHRIQVVLERYKEEAGQRAETKCKIPLTRQQIADLTGLRVETVIRAMKEMEKDNLIRIVRGKVYF